MTRHSGYRIRGAAAVVIGLGCCLAVGADAPKCRFVPLFNGKDLTGWEGNPRYWSARDGMIVGQSPGIKQQSFLCTTKTYGDFIFRCRFRLVGGEGNSGVQFRSKRVAHGDVSGYQADIGQQYWGCLYDEARRNRTLVQAPRDRPNIFHKTGWNDLVIRARGTHIALEYNGVQTVDYTETDPSIVRRGIIGLQIHPGGPMEVQFKDLEICGLDR